MKRRNFVPKTNCPACGRDIKTDNNGVLDAHYNQRVGKLCPGGAAPQPAVALIDTLRPDAPWEEK